ncbi:MAG: transporter substrate-binding domain-containing protein [Clostridiales bacterium]|nr:transporter substrate-binding domain-containing protein [Clostridiales bacterium]
MARRIRTYGQRPVKNKIQRKLNIFLKNLNKKAVLAVLGIIILAAAVLIFVTSGDDAQMKKAKLMNENEIVIGIGLEHSSFGRKNEDGTLSGFEVDLAKLLMEDLVPGKEIEFVAIEDQEASYLLRNGEIDLAFSMLVPGTIKSQGLSLSSAYYQDEIVLMTTESRARGALSAIGSTKVYAIDMKKQTLSEMFSDLAIKNVRVISCSSYPDAVLAVTQSSAFAVAAPAHKAEVYLHGLFALAQESGKTVSYTIAAWTENSDFISLINESLHKNKDEIEALKNRWGI